MFSPYPSAYFQRPSYYHYDNGGLARDYLHALAQQQARERQEAQYRARLEEARRRRAYQEQFARAEAMRRNNPHMAGFGDHPHSSFFRPTPHTPRQNARPVYHVDPHDYPRMRRESSEDSLDQQAEQDIARARQTQRRSSVARSDVSRPSRSPSANTKTKVVVEQATPTPPSQKPDARDTAARTIQSFVRAQLPRLSAFKAIEDISRRLEDAKTNFELPSTLDFAESSADVNAVPALLFTPRNAPLHGHEHALVKLLSNLDAVESHGDARIRRVRKELVRRIESELSVLDAKTSDVWRRAAREREAQAQDASDHVDSSELAPLEAMSLNSEVVEPAPKQCVEDLSVNEPEEAVKPALMDTNLPSALDQNEQDMNAVKECVADMPVNEMGADEKYVAEMAVNEDSDAEPQGEADTDEAIVEEL